MKFIDTHSHLCDKAFNDDRNVVIEKSFDLGVNKIIEISCDPKDWDKAEKLCLEFKDSIFSSFGIHPEYAGSEDDESVQKLKEYLQKPFSVGIGEIGFDYYWEPEKKEKQFVLFEKMINISNDLNIPAIFHVRNPKNPETGNAYGDIVNALEKSWKVERKKKRGVLHCFSGNWDDAKAGLDLGLLLGINGTFTYKKNAELRDIVKKAGIENIVLETDCPYLPPEGKRGKRNDPSNIPLIGMAIAEFLNLPVEKLAEIINHNCEELLLKK